MRKSLREIFFDVESRKFFVVNDVLAFVTLVSVLAIVLETVPSFQKFYGIFQIVEYVAVFLFSIEYVGRIIASKKPLSYVGSFFGIIDLIAIIPSYLGITNLTFLKSARLLRIIRFLRMLRLVKIIRMRSWRISHEDEEVRLHAISVQIYLIAVLFTITISSSLIYTIEGHREIFSTIPMSMIWAAKVLLGGVPQIMPETIAGEMILISTRFVGLLLFGLLITIVGNSAKEFLFGKSEK